jgi:Lar family restriction alleviation protein
MSQPLLPCPFCGGTDQFVERADYSSCFVQCNCNARGPVGVQSSDDEETPGRDDAITEWNRRTEPSPAEAKVGMQLIRADVVEFLRGAGLLDGCAFGERPLGAEGEFWWRQYLPDEATAEVSSEGPSSLAIAGIGQRHFGNPIPKEWYAAAKDLVKSCQALSQQSPARVEGELTDDEAFKLWLETQLTSVYPVDSKEFKGLYARAIERALNQRLAVKEGEAVGRKAELRAAEKIIADYKEHYDFPDQGESHMHDCITSYIGTLSTHPVSDDQQAKDAARWSRILDLICTDDGNALFEVLSGIGFSGEYPTQEEMTAAIDAALSATKQEEV